MLKRIGIPIFALVALLILFSTPQAANAAVRFGVYVGAPVYTYPAYPYAYAYPRYYAPYPVYTYPAPVYGYGYPYSNYFLRVHRRHEWREHEWREHHRGYRR
jgi:hypothetical protein